MINPTFPNNTNEEISNLFYITFGRMKAQSPNFYKDIPSFSLSDYLEIDHVGEI